MPLSLFKYLFFSSRYLVLKFSNQIQSLNFSYTHKLHTTHSKPTYLKPIYPNAIIPKLIQSHISNLANRKFEKLISHPKKVYHGVLRLMISFVILNPPWKRKFRFSYVIFVLNDPKNPWVRLFRCKYSIFLRIFGRYLESDILQIKILFFSDLIFVFSDPENPQVWIFKTFHRVEKSFYQLDPVCLKGLMA